MAAILYPATLPEPSVADIQSAERRQFSEGEGPRASRPVQRARQAIQQVAWTLTPEQAEAFQAWWADDLSEGGAWFTAKWPAPKGWGLATRKFLGTPAWAHIATEFWRVTAEVELRGAVEIEVITEVSDPGPVLWADTYTGAGATLLTDHEQDTPLNSSTWGSGGGGQSVPVLTGTGEVTHAAAQANPASAITAFGGSVVTLSYPYHARAEFTPVDWAGTAAETYSGFVGFLNEGGDVAFEIAFVPNRGGSLPGVISIFAGDVTNTFELASGFNVVTLQLEADGWTATVNGVVEAKETTATPANSLYGVQVYIGTDFDTGGHPSQAFSRTAIFGELAP